MEPTEAQIEAAYAAFKTGTLRDAVRAAFAAVPDPEKLSKRWEAAYALRSDADRPTAQDCADELRAFMRGES